MQTEQCQEEHRRPAWTPEEEQAMLERLLDYGGRPWARGGGDCRTGGDRSRWAQSPRARRARKRRCAVLALLAVALWTRAFFRVPADAMLLWAAEHGNVPVAWAAMVRGATPTRQGKYGTPMLRAASNGRKGVVALFLARGVRANESDCRGNTALLVAAASGSAETVSLLLDSGADVNIRNKHGESPLRYALYFGGDPKGARETIRLLLEHGARHDVFTAAALGDAKALREIVASDPKTVNAQGFYSTTPLHWAAERGNTEAARCLLAAGADVNAGPPEIDSPLGEAVRWHRRGTVKLLLEAGADPNLRHRIRNTGRYGPSSLSVALEAGYEEIVELLREYGARE